MAVPQAVLDGLNKVDGDFGALASNASAQKSASDALAVAQHAKDVADAAVAAGAGTVVADKDALKALIDSTYPTPTPVAPVA